MSPKKPDEDIEVAAEGPLGLRGTLKGPLGWILVIVGIATILFQVYVHERDAKARQADIVVEFHKGQDAILKKFDDVIYVLVLPQDKRDKLNLAEPEGIRNMRRFRQDGDR